MADPIFPGQRLRVLPRPLVDRALQAGLTSKLLVTDAGFFPHAAGHFRHRRHGAPEAVIIVCVGGLGWARVNGELIRVPAGSTLVLPPRQPHAYWSDSTKPWTIWWLHVAGADVEALVGLADSRPDEGVIEVSDLLGLTARLDETLGCLERDETIPTLVQASGVAWAALAQLAADRLSGVRRHRREPIQDAQSHLRQHYTGRIRVPELAKQYGLSPSHFATLFRAATGYSVTEYIRSLRMARARELLSTSDLTVSAVAAIVGYNDPFHFSRQFRRQNGCSPSDYRQQNRHGDSGSASCTPGPELLC